MSLIQRLRHQLVKDKAIPFVDFMHMALYAPIDGYYSSSRPKLGKCGDFVTAPELTPLFGKTLANQLSQILNTLKTPFILEYGAGSGKLCVDILSHLDALNCLPKAYYILEVSASLRQYQEDTIQKSLPQLADIVIWLDGWPDFSFNGIILANEVLDAMPVHRFMKTEAGLFESYIALENNELKERFLPCQNQRLNDYIKKELLIDSLPYISEVNLFIEDWIYNNYQLLKQGALLLIDYGFPRHEYYHPQRNQGTLMCHYQHRAHTNYLLAPGEQDISAHVDFTHVAEAGLKAGFHVEGFTNQASFLLANDLLSFILPMEDQKTQFQAKQAIKQLIHPSEMGELFKVMALTKDLNVDLRGFQLQDKRASL